MFLKFFFFRFLNIEPYEIQHFKTLLLYKHQLLPVAVTDWYVHTCGKLGVALNDGYNYTVSRLGVWITC